MINDRGYRAPARKCFTSASRALHHFARWTEVIRESLRRHVRVAMHLPGRRFGAALFRVLVRAHLPSVGSVISEQEASFDEGPFDAVLIIAAEIPPRERCPCGDQDAFTGSAEPALRFREGPQLGIGA